MAIEITRGCFNVVTPQEVIATHGLRDGRRHSDRFNVVTPQEVIATRARGVRLSANWSFNVVTPQEVIATLLGSGQFRFAGGAST